MSKQIITTEKEIARSYLKNIVAIAERNRAYYDKDKANTDPYYTGLFFERIGDSSSLGLAMRVAPWNSPEMKAIEALLDNEERFRNPQFRHAITTKGQREIAEQLNEILANYEFRNAKQAEIFELATC